MKNYFILFFTLVFSLSAYSQSNIKVFKSVNHKIQYSYNDVSYVTAPINNAPHMLLKLNSTSDNFGTITISAWSEYDWTGVDLYDPDVLSYYKNADKDTERKDENMTSKVISSCEKVTICGNKKALRSVSTLKSPAYGIDAYAYTYRFINGAEAQSITLFISKSVVTSQPDLERKLVNSIKFL